MHPYIFKKVSVIERSPRVGLKVESPDLWVARDVTDWYQRFCLKHWADMGRVCWSEPHG
jgi:hypothetical protein